MLIWSGDLIERGERGEFAGLEGVGRRTRAAQALEEFTEIEAGSLLVVFQGWRFGRGERKESFRASPGIH